MGGACSKTGTQVHDENSSPVAKSNKTDDGGLQELKVDAPTGFTRQRRSSLAVTPKVSARRPYAPPLQYFLEDCQFEEGQDEQLIPWNAVRRAILSRWTWQSGIGGSTKEEEKVPDEMKQNGADTNVEAAAAAAAAMNTPSEPVDSAAFEVKQIQMEFELRFRELNAVRKHLDLPLLDFHERKASEVVTLSRQTVSALLKEAIVKLDDGTNRSACHFKSWFERHSEDRLKEDPCLVCTAYTGGRKQVEPKTGGGEATKRASQRRKSSVSNAQEAGLGKPQADAS
jgi:predicted DNA-binding protein (UPF0251 family)